MSNATITATILIAEDDSMVRELLSMALEANGYEAVTVSNVHDALACISTRQIDLLLLDIGLGAESGLDLLSSLRLVPQGKNLPVILLTGRADRQTVLHCAHMGVQSYMVKHQFSRKELLARIDQHLKHRELLSAPATDVDLAESPKWLPQSNSKSPKPRRTGIAIAANPGPELQAAEFLERGAPYADLLRSVKPIINRAQTLAQVDRCAELKALSPTAAQLMKMTAESNFSMEEIAQVIKRDQAIALKVLQIANSVVYARAGAVDSVQKALSRIGLSQIRQLVLNISLVDNFHLSGLGEHFNSELFWEHSIATGLIASTIARFRRSDPHAIDLAFTMGLLHDVARMVFVQQLHDIYKRVMDTAARLELPLEQVETCMLQINHADAVDRLLCAWKFPKSLIQPIAMHHLSAEKIGKLAPEMITEVSTLALANRLAHALLLGSSGNNCQYSTDEFAKVLQLTPEAMAFIEQQIPTQTREMKNAMLQSGACEGCLDYRKIAMGKFRRPIRPIFIGASPETDGHRMLLDRLKDTNEPQRPNIAVMHLPTMNDSLFGLLAEREKTAGAKPLPLIVLSPTSNLKLEPRLVAGRKYKVVPSPFVLSRLIDAINHLLEDAAE
jgi:HD-like signal output (HDOD) protein/CheY-like chemotaxis protein